MTQFPFNRPGDKQSFPILNRIVAGMTLDTVVVEANLTSGALITVAPRLPVPASCRGGLLANILENYTTVRQA